MEGGRPGCGRAPGSSRRAALAPGGLLKHLAVVDDNLFTAKLRGEGLGDPWETLWDGDDWPFTSAADDPPERLDAFWDEAVGRVRRATRQDAAPRSTVTSRAPVRSSRSRPPAEPKRSTTPVQLGQRTTSAGASA